MWRGVFSLPLVLFFLCWEHEEQGSMAGTAVYRGGGVTMKLAAIMGSCVLLLLVAGCGVDGKASGEAHPHQGKVKVRLGEGEDREMGGVCLRETESALRMACL